MIETLQIAFVSTILAMTISLPMALLAARNVGTFRTSVVIRIILAAFRSTVSDLGNILCNTHRTRHRFRDICHDDILTIGYLGKLQYEAIEGMNGTPGSR